MRITLTLDDDTAARLQSLACHTDRWLAVVIHENGEQTSRATTDRRFRVAPVSLGAPPASGEGDCTSAPLHAIEGPKHR